MITTELKKRKLTQAIEMAIRIEENWSLILDRNIIIEVLSEILTERIRSYNELLEEKIRFEKEKNMKEYDFMQKFW